MNRKEVGKIGEELSGLGAGTEDLQKRYPNLNLDEYVWSLCYYDIVYKLEQQGVLDAYTEDDIRDLGRHLSNGMADASGWSDILDTVIYDFGEDRASGVE